METIKNRLKDYKDKLNSEKLFISFIPILLETLDYENEKNSIISKYDEIKKILDLKDANIYKYLYFNKKKVHDILYDKDEVITVIFLKEKIMIFYFYLNLLINENKTIINYSYSIDLINEINNLQKNNNYNIYKKILISKFIIDLINNYKQSENYKEEEEKEILNKIEKENDTIINNNFQFFKTIGLDIQKNEIISKKIDEIYIELITSLIKSKKFDSYEEIYKIISELELENIFITKTMFDKLSNILNSEECNYYIIKDREDLFIQKKINFYYILLKFILKNTIYIYNIDSLNNTRKKNNKINKR